MVTLNTPSLILRPFTSEDADAYYAAVLSDEDIMRGLPTGWPVPRPRVESIIAGIQDNWEELGYGLWAVIQAGKLIGHCGLQPLDQRNYIELTCTLQNLDLAVEAGQACLVYAFETLRLDEIMGVIFPGNPLAQPLYHRLGMQFFNKLYAYNQELRVYHIHQGDF